MKFPVVIEQDEDGMFIASCLPLPGCWSQGKTHDEATQNVNEAIQAYLESREKSNDPIPSVTS